MYTVSSYIVFLFLLFVFFLLLLFISLSSFFLFKQKTAYEMRISDWSSDVCSSDLLHRRPHRIGCHVHHHVGAVPAGDLLDPLFGILVGHIDGVGRTELTGEFQFGPVALQAGDDDVARARLAGRDDASQAPLSGAQYHQRVTHLELWHLHRPAVAGAQRVEHHGDLGRQALVDLVHERIRVQVHVLGIGAPQARTVVQRDIGVDPSVPAEVIGAQAARHAKAARDHGLHHHSVAHVHGPAPGRVVADLGDYA